MHLELHTTFPQDLAPAWNALLKESVTDAPFLRHDYLGTWWQTRGGGEWNDATLALITAHDDDQLVGVAPLFATTNRDGLPALMLLGSIEISDWLDLIVRRADLTDFIAALFAFIDSHPALAGRVLDLYNLPDSSPVLKALQTESAKRGWICTEEVYQPTPYIALPGDFEQYLGSLDKKQRHEIRRKMRRASETGRNVRWYIVANESNLDAEIEGFFALMANDPRKAAFLTEAMRQQMKRSAHDLFRAGLLQLAFMEVDGEKACGYFNIDYNDRIWVYNSGLDRRFNELSPGWVLLAHLLEWANQNKRREYDFLRGDEDYKYKFGGVNRFVMRVRVKK
jgi:CelD/BcsL family acetyltransferase involved in cellulose biosynthesis